MKVLRTNIQKTLYQKTYELQTGYQKFAIDFKGCEKQYDSLENSLVEEKSDKHLINYNKNFC